MEELLELRWDRQPQAWAHSDVILSRAGFMAYVRKIIVTTRMAREGPLRGDREAN